TEGITEGRQRKTNLSVWACSTASPAVIVVLRRLAAIGRTATEAEIMVTVEPAVGTGQVARTLLTARSNICRFTIVRTRRAQVTAGATIRGVSLDIRARPRAEVGRLYRTRACRRLRST